MPSSAESMILLPGVLTTGLVAFCSDNGLLSVILTGWIALLVAGVCLDKPSIVADDFYYKQEKN